MTTPNGAPKRRGGALTRRVFGTAALAGGAGLLILRGAGPSGAQRFTGLRMPYDDFDSLHVVHVDVPRGVLDVAIVPGDLAVSHETIMAWVKKSAEAVSTYFGRFPVKRAKVLIVPVGGKGVTGGKSWGYRGAALRLLVGNRSDADDLLIHDWQMVHEMTHFSLPDMPGGHIWLAEGVAVYVESIARAQAGHRTDSEIWGEFARDMPKGLPRAGDQGLDGTDTWGRTYWGGAIFCLMADVETRKRTDNKKGLQDGLRGILAAGGSCEVDWPIERILSVADKATGTTVLADLYAEQRDKPVSPDLDALWRDLGVIPKGGRATFNDDAPLAALRRAITAKSK